MEKSGIFSFPFKEGSSNIPNENLLELPHHKLKLKLPTNAPKMSLHFCLSESLILDPALYEGLF